MQEVVNGGATVGEGQSRYGSAPGQNRRGALSTNAHEATLSGSQIQPFHLNQDCELMGEEAAAYSLPFPSTALIANVGSL